MKNTVIYFLRHGEVENPKKIIYGRLPGFNLSENGIKRIKEAAQELKNRKIDYLYASPMRRTRQSAQIISQVLKIKIRISRYLIESKLIHAGLPLEIFKRDIQPILYQDKFIKQGQESPESQSVRMWRFVQMMKGKHPGKTIIAVSHGDPIVILKARILNKPFSWQFKLDNYLQPGNYLILTCDGDTCRIK